MGAHAAWWAEQSRKRLEGVLHIWTGFLARLLTSPDKLLVVADFEPSESQLRRRFGGLPGFLAVPTPVRHTWPAVTTGLAATGVNPIELGTLTAAARQAGCRTIAFWLPWDQVRGQTLLRCWRQGFRWTWLQVGKGGWLLPTALVAAWRGLVSWNQRLWKAGTPWTDNQAQLIVAALPARHRQTPGEAGPRSLRIGHFLRTWTFGGVERQLALLAGLQRESGQQPQVLLQTAPPGWLDGRLAFLRKGLAARPIALHAEVELPARWQAAGLHDFPWHRLPADLRRMVLDLTGELLLRPVDVLHCWIDEANIVGWLAARLAGIRCVVMTVLGVSPAHWPLGDRPWLRALARQAVRAAGTRLVTISEAGRRDYAEWLDEEPSRIEVIRIGFSLPPMPKPEQVAAFRAAHNLSPETPVVIGVFRLDPEKRPLTFLEVVARVRRAIPDVHVFLAGHGILTDQVRQQILRLELQRTVTLLGQAEDVLTPMAAADVFLMCSQVEGTPNVALEAQALGCVPVLTDVGGCRETLLPGETGEVVARDDLNGLAAAVVRLLREPARRRVMAAAGRAFVAENFAPEQLARRFDELYSRLEQE